MKKEIRQIGTIAINSLVKFPRQKTLWQVLEHKDGYTCLEEYSDCITKLFFGPAFMTIADRIEIQIIEGF